MKTTNDKLSILTAMLYMRMEANEANLHFTQKYLKVACEAFFDDLERTGELKGDMLQIHSFLANTEHMNEAELKELIRLIQRMEAQNDNYEIRCSAR